MLAPQAAGGMAGDYTTESHLSPTVLSQILLQLQVDIMAKKKTSTKRKAAATSRKSRKRKSPVSRAGSKKAHSCSQLSATRLDDAEQLPLAHFHKGLGHDPSTGQVESGQFAWMIEQLKKLNADPDHTAKHGFQLRQDTCESLRKFVNPQAGWALDTQMTDPCCYSIPVPPNVYSEFAAAEAIEVYWMALLRDVPFIEWEDNPRIAEEADELGNLPLFINRLRPNDDPETAGFESLGNRITAKSVFRGGELARVSDPNVGISEEIGPFVSQFLLHEIPYGTLRIPQRFVHAVPKVDYMTQWPEWLAVQNGKNRNPHQNLVGEQDAGKRRHLATMRDLATYVHFDALYEAYLNAALILLGGGYPTNPGNPYGPGCSAMGIGQDYNALQHGHYLKAVGKTRALPRYPDQDGFATFGGPQILSLVTEVATRALKAVWRQKWTLLRLRPEAYGGLVHRDRTANPTPFDGFPPNVERLLRGSPALERTLERRGRRGRRRYRDDSVLLPMAFPEGSPTHPAYGAGHATVAGACVTVLKAFFDASVQFIGPVQPSADGQHLVAYRGSDAHSGRLTVELELHKLAANIAIGRNMAGVHWRSDYTQSMLLGQRVAIDMLYRQSVSYTEDYWLKFNSFGGKPIKIGAGEIYYAGTKIVSSNSIDPWQPTKREMCDLAHALQRVV